MCPPNKQFSDCIVVLASIVVLFLGSNGKVMNPSSSPRSTWPHPLLQVFATSAIRGIRFLQVSDNPRILSPCQLPISAIFPPRSCGCCTWTGRAAPGGSSGPSPSSTGGPATSGRIAGSQAGADHHPLHRFPRPHLCQVWPGI